MERDNNKSNNNNMNHIGHDDTDDSHYESADRLVPESRSSSDNNSTYYYPKLLIELMVKHSKNLKGLENNNLEEEFVTPRMISLGELLIRHNKYETKLDAMKARVIKQFKSVMSKRHVGNFWLLVTLVEEDNQAVIVTKFEQFRCSKIAIDLLYENEDKYSVELIDLSGVELNKIKEEYPNKVGNMATTSELDSTGELILSLYRGLISLMFKIKLMRLHYIYLSGRVELEELLETMFDSVVDELSQYEQEVDVAAEKLRQALQKLQLKVVAEKREGFDDDEETMIEQIRIQEKVVELKVKEWLDMVTSRQQVISKKARLN